MATSSGPRTTATSTNEDLCTVISSASSQQDKKKVDMIFSRRRRESTIRRLSNATATRRIFVKHCYHDHLHDARVDACGQATSLPTSVLGKHRGRPRGGATLTFPEILHKMLTTMDAEGRSHVVSWQRHGRCFLIHKKKEFVEETMPRFFQQTKLTSFQRQLNLYGFTRLTSGPDRGAYYHELFLRGRKDLTLRMTRTKVKGNGMKASSSPETEPDFYAMEYCGSEDEEPQMTTVCHKTACSSRSNAVITSERLEDVAVQVSIISSLDSDQHLAMLDRQLRNDGETSVLAFKEQDELSINKAETTGMTVQLTPDTTTSVGSTSLSSLTDNQNIGLCPGNTSPASSRLPPPTMISPLFSPHIQPTVAANFNSTYSISPLPTQHERAVVQDQYRCQVIPFLPTPPLPFYSTQLPLVQQQEQQQQDQDSTTQQQLPSSGDLVAFEGLTFRYLDHSDLDEMLCDVDHFSSKA